MGAREFPVIVYVLVFVGPIVVVEGAVPDRFEAMVFGGQMVSLWGGEQRCTGYVSGLQG